MDAKDVRREFIEFFTKKGERVLDPMVGTGSTLIGCLRSGRHGVGIELNPDYATIAHQLIEEERTVLADQLNDLHVEVIQGGGLQFSLPPVQGHATSV